MKRVRQLEGDLLLAEVGRMDLSVMVKERSYCYGESWVEALW